jgi:hypothetical protein
LYAVLIGAASGLVANLLAFAGNSLARREEKRRERLWSQLSDSLPSDEEVRQRALTPEFREFQLQYSEGVLREHDPADFQASPLAAMECLESVCFVEDQEWWRAGYDSLDAFYGEHEARHPDIRLYGTLFRELALEDPTEPPDGTGDVIARWLAEHRPSAPATQALDETEV